MKIKFWLILILFLAASLRLWNVSNNPPGLTWDEVALGYNAYSIMLTGRDEYGTLLPLNLKSFGDYKPSFYAYLDIPFIAVFGLTELAIRLPSAIIGILTVFVVFLLVQQLFKNQLLSLLSAFFVAVSPLAIQFSRPAFESNLAVFLNILGVYFFLKGLKQKKWIFLSVILFAFSSITYQASRVFVPLLVLALVVICKKDIDKKVIVTALTLFFALFSAVMLATILPGQTNRLSTLNYFAYQRSEEVINTITIEDGFSKYDFGFQILHGEWWAYIKGLVERYLIYFSPKVLIIDGDYSQRHRVPDLGSMYYFSVVLLPLGFIFLLRQKGNASKLLLVWLLLAPIPAVLSRDLINMLRAFNMVIPLEVLQAGGVMFLIERLKGKRILLKLVLVLLSTTFLVNFSIYIDRYFIHAPKEYSKYWLYGYKQVIKSLGEKSKQYDKIVFTDSFGQPYIYYLFYSKYPPQRFQNQAHLEQNSADIGTIRRIDNIEFRHVDWPADRGVKNSLFIGTLEELPDKDVKPFSEFTILKDINFLDGQSAFRIVETR